MFEKIAEAIGLINEGAQDGAKLFQSFTTAGTDFAGTFAKAFEGIKNALIPVVNYIGKLVAKIQEAQ